MAKGENEELAPIIVKKVKKVAGGHHGGAWKVAYADFVTAMMAFFLLMWLLNVTTKEQKNAISNYFDPSHPKVSQSVSGSGGLLGGMTVSPIGAMSSNVQPLSPVPPSKAKKDKERGDTDPGDVESLDPDTAKKLSEAQLEEELRKREDERFKQAAQNLKKQIQNNPDLKSLGNNVIIDITPEGLRIQIVDDKGRSMFPSGSAVMYDFMRQILKTVTGVIIPLPNQVSVRGHTDSTRYKDPKKYDNWNLSSDRAQASRRVIEESGLPIKRMANVMGKADREHLLPKDPQNPRNRRISILLLRDRIANGKIIKADAPAKKEIPAKVEKEEPKKPTGIQIIDDTKAKKPAPQTGTPPTTGDVNATQPPVKNAPKEGDTFAVEIDPLQNPLPVVPSTIRIPKPKRSITFGDSPEGDSNSLYEGPKQDVFVDESLKQPITKIVPHGKSSQENTPMKSMDFGDAPAQVGPTDAIQVIKAPQSNDTTKKIDFGDDEEAMSITGPEQSIETAPTTSSGGGSTIIFGDEAPDFEIISPTNP